MGQGRGDPSDVIAKPKTMAMMPVVQKILSEEDFNSLFGRSKRLAESCKPSA
jgi:hypothetical protein